MQRLTILMLKQAMLNTSLKEGNAYGVVLVDLNFMLCRILHSYDGLKERNYESII